MALHRDLVDENLHAAGILSDSDPGAIGAGKVWFDTSGGAGSWVVKIRNSTNDAWEVAVVAAGVTPHVHDYTDYQIDVVSNGSTTTPEVVFAGGDVVSIDIPTVRTTEVN
jgi:hypothetical protein